MATKANTSEQLPSYSQVACVGAGLAAVALGAQLKRWYGVEDIRFFERNDNSGGTWYVNSYPGMYILSLYGVGIYPNQCIRSRLRCPECSL